VKAPGRFPFTAGATFAVAAVLVSVASGAAPLPLWQRVLLGGEYRGFTPQADAPQVGNLAAAAKITRNFFSALKPGAAAVEYRRDGFRGAVTEDLAGPTKSSSAISFAVQLGSDAAAVHAEKFFELASVLPCPHTCTVSAFDLKVPGIHGALGSYRIRTTNDGPRMGPFELDQVFFTSGPFTYGILTFGAPQKVDRSQLFAAAKRLSERVKGAPPVKG